MCEKTEGKRISTDMHSENSIPEVCRAMVVERGEGGREHS